MNKPCLYLLLSLAAMSVPTVDAQEMLQPPKPPLVAMPPDGSTWSMEIETRPASQPAVAVRNSGSNPKRMERRIGKNHAQQVIITLANGTSQQFYIVVDHLLQKCDHSEAVVALPLEKNDPSVGLVDALRVAMFPGTEWVSPKNYVGVVPLDHYQCYKYHVAGTPELQAWIKTKDKYPLQIQIGSTLYRFSEVTPFPKDVEVPAAYQAALSGIQSEQHALDALKQMAK